MTCLLKNINFQLLTLKAYEPGRPIEEVARELHLAPEAITKLASNESAFGVSPKAIAAIHQAAGEMYLYPDGNSWHLHQKLAEFHRISPENIVIGNGSNELIDIIGHCFMSPGKSVVYSQYAFIIYKTITQLFHAEGIEVPMREGLVHNLDAIADAIRPDTSLVFICNPNNPTGTMVEEAEIDRLMSRVPEETLVVFDEAYAELCLGRMPNTLKFVQQGRNCIILRTFSKAYGLAGLRVGYGIGQPEVIEMLNRARQAFNCNRMAQIAACAALEDQEFVEKSRQNCMEGKAYLEGELTRMGLTFIPTYANFILIRVGAGRAIFEKLQQKGVIVRPMDGYLLPEWIRVTIGKPEQNQKFIAQLKAIL